VQEQQIAAAHIKACDHQHNSSSSTFTVANSVSAAEPACSTREMGPAALLTGAESSTTLSSSDAAAHRIGRGIGVVKKLWSVKSSKVCFPSVLYMLLAEACRFASMSSWANVHHLSVMSRSVYIHILPCIPTSHQVAFLLNTVKYLQRILLAR
jgi:hypothetical protein